MEEFLKKVVPRKINLYERNYKVFNEREFNETFINMDWNEILSLFENAPNISLNNLHQHINLLLDEIAPYKKVTKKQYKLKSKPWINGDILSKMQKRDNLLHKYCKSTNKDSAESKAIYEEYKIIRNELTNLKRESKFDYYHRYFEANKHKTSCICKGIISIVNINKSSRKGITLMDDNGINLIQKRLLKYSINTL